MNAKPTVLIVGITGVLGGKIANAILDQGIIQVRGLVRSLSPDKQQRMQDFTQRGVEWVEGDLFNLSSLDQACKGVDIVVSAAKDYELIKTEFLFFESAAQPRFQKISLGFY